MAFTSLVSPTLTLDWQDSPTALPLFQRIAESIARDVRRGRLLAGTRLPSSRALAGSLGVHRNTVLAAFAELERQGYLETRPARGTFVRSTLPDAPPRRFRGPREVGPVDFDLPELRFEPFRPLARGTLALVGGFPDLRQMPIAAWTRAHRAALRTHPRGLDYQIETGDPRLVAALSNYLAETRGVVSGPGEMLVTRGSQLGLHLAARALITPTKKTIAVEALGYRPAWEGFRLAGAELVPIQVDEHGISVEALRRLLDERKLAAVYLTPHHQYPTTKTLSAERRLALLSLATERRLPVIEDDYDHEFHFEGRPILPLASADPGRVVIHVGTFSKVFAPGLRAGYVVAQAEIVRRMARHRTFLDRQGDHVSERALALFIEDGSLGAHIRKMHRIYAERRQVFFDELEKRLRGALAFTPPPGGLAVWAKLDQDFCPEATEERAFERNLVVQPGKRFAFDERSRPYFRLGFARHDPKELREGVKRLAESLVRARRATKKG